MTEPNQLNSPSALPPENETQTRINPVFFGAVALIVLVLAFMTIGAALPYGMAPEAQTAMTGGTGVFDPLSLEAKAALVIDIQSGKTIYEKNPDVQLALASLAKVALVLVVAEALPEESVITIPYYAGGASGKAHLSKGERWRLADVIDFTLVASSNSGAEILASAANDIIHERYPESPRHTATLWRMNELASSLGLQRTFFLNVNGLDLSATQASAYGSARDIASLFSYAASANPSLFAGTARGGILLTALSGETSAAFNTNQSQGAIPGLIMGKTGFTDLAGGNLAVVFDVGLAHPVVAVVLGSSEKGRFEDMQKLVVATRKSLMESSPNI